MRTSIPGWGNGIRVARIALFLASRLAFGAFLLLTPAYCLLAHIPFSYFGFIHNPLMPWIGSFVHAHAYLYSGILLLLMLDLAPQLRQRKTRISVLLFLLVNLSFCFYLLFRWSISTLSPNFFSYLCAILALLPLLWLAVIDISASDGDCLWGRWRDPGTQKLATSVLASLGVTAVFAGTAAFRDLRSGGAVRAHQLFVGFGASLIFHLVIFAAFGVGLFMLRVASDKTPWPRQTYFILSRTLVCCLCVQVLRRMVLPALSFEGMQADFLCVLLSLAVVTFITGLPARLRTIIGGSRDAARRPDLLWWVIAAAVALLSALAWAIPTFLGPTDWDFVLQTTAVFAVWAAVFAVLGWSGLRLHGRAWKTAAAAVLLVTSSGFAPLKLSAAPNYGDVFDVYAGWDLSFKTAYAVLSRSVDNGKYTAFYNFLKQNTNLHQSVGPADLSLVNDLKPSKGRKPHIFVFVIDSLRQDYLSPYNREVDFTPQLGKFAQDSVVFPIAFTRYGGTALSEPAIWAGVMLPHKQFVRPFYPINNLQKLIDTEGYESFISVDPILQEILRPSSSITKLDEDTRLMSDYEYAVNVKGVNPRSINPTRQNTRSWSTLDFVSTLHELESRIDTRVDRERPFFVYTQPQNLHTVTLEQSRLYGSRREMSIAELQRMDAAFGEFIRFLEAKHLYENSVIAITADHGELYGEFGRYGHSDFVFPEVMRIPLIIHLPEKIRRQVKWDRRRMAFSIDITPSLYYLLGHRPTLNSDLAGRPLFTEGLEEQDAYVRSEYLIASSYAPVYGIIGRAGGTLLIVDAVNQTNCFYDLLTDPEGVHNRVTPQVRDSAEAFIRREIATIDSAYGVRASLEPAMR